MMDIVLISTDDPARADEIRNRLSRYGLQEIESWVFSRVNDQRLRYEVDPAWYGELPRSYLYDFRTVPVAISGPLDVDVVTRWIESNLQPGRQGSGSK